MGSNCPVLLHFQLACFLPLRSSLLIFYSFFSNEWNLPFGRPCLIDCCLISRLATLIQEMNSDDPVIQQRAVQQTEERLMLMEEAGEEDGCRTALNKTTISPPQAAAQVSCLLWSSISSDITKTNFEGTT